MGWGFGVGWVVGCWAGKVAGKSGRWIDSAGGTHSPENGTLTEMLVLWRNRLLPNKRFSTNPLPAVN